MEEWHYQFPSLTKRIKVVGDYQRSLAYTGEVRKILYQLKNNMKFQQLGQLRMVRYFIDGTVIIAKSVFGLDSVEIRVSGRDLLFGIGFCSITLINVPEIVQPMRYPGEIKPFEVEGVDYIKTYYVVDMSACMGCVLEWNMMSSAMRESDAFSIYKLFNPFIFHDLSVAEWIDDYRWFYGYGPHETHPYVDASLIRPDDHCIHSLYNNCGAEIIEFGSDEDGSWIKWKVYTEYSYPYPLYTPYSRTGFGVMELNGFVGTRNVNPLWTPETAYVGMEALVVDETCSDKGRILVDCCHKAEGIRTVNLWWESLSGYEAGGPTCIDQPFMFYGSMKICEVPPVIGPLYVMLCTPRNTKVFYVIPEIKGGCIPFTWELVSGAGWTLTPSQPLGETAGLAYECSLGFPNCHESVDVTVTDRCGTTDTFHSKSCCENQASGSLSIGYTSLLMGCSQSQGLTANGGCPPYSWSLTGGDGTITTGGSGNWLATYTSPDTNPNCVNNPTIQVTDCCGSSTQIKLAVNCNPDGAALCHTALSFSNAECVSLYDCKADGVNSKEIFNCDGSYFINPCYGSAYGKWCTCGEGNVCHPCTPGKILDFAEHYDVLMGCGGCYDGAKFWNTLTDLRTTAMKEGGCCPINPITGLPYD